MIVYRLSKWTYVATAYAGEGGIHSAGRWNPLGVRMAYASSSRPLALLEMLVRRPANDLQKMNQLYAMCPAEIPSHLALDLRSFAALPPNWRDVPPPTSTRKLGRDWISSKASLALIVPSVLMPTESNYLVDPAHPAYGQLRLLPPEPLSLDGRVLNLKD